MAEARRHPRLRRLLINLGLVCGGLLVVLLILEVVLSQTHLFGARRAYVRPDPLLRYRFQPGASYWFQEENDHAIQGRINRHGWRDRERDLAKPADVYRVALLGDSYVEALQVEQDSTFALVAEDALNAPGAAGERGYQFLNFSRSGFTQSEQWLVLLHDVMQFDPDLVAVFFYPGNDIRDIHPETAATPRPFFTPTADGELVLDVSFQESRQYQVRRWLNPIQRHSALVSLVVARLSTARQAQRIQDDAQRDKAAVQHLPAHQSLGGQHPDPRYARNYELCKRLLERMIEFCRDRDVAFLLVTLPDAYKVDDVATLQRIDPEFDAHFFSQDLARFAETAGVAHLSLQESFEAAAAAGEDLRWVHWNYAGHRTVAGALQAKVLELSSP